MVLRVSMMDLMNWLGGVDDLWLNSLLMNDGLHTSFC